MNLDLKGLGILFIALGFICPPQSSANPIENDIDRNGVKSKYVSCLEDAAKSRDERIQEFKVKSIRARNSVWTLGPWLAWDGYRVWQIEGDVVGTREDGGPTTPLNFTCFLLLSPGGVDGREDDRITGTYCAGIAASYGWVRSDWSYKAKTCLTLFNS